MNKSSPLRHIQLDDLTYLISYITGFFSVALEDIPQDDFVIEYVGQQVRSGLADRREIDYTKKGIGSSYLFRLDGTHVIDATKHGNSGKILRDDAFCVTIR